MKSLEFYNALNESLIRHANEYLRDVTPRFTKEEIQVAVSESIKECNIQIQKAIKDNYLFAVTFLHLKIILEVKLLDLKDSKTIGKAKSAFLGNRSSGERSAPKNAEFPPNTIEKLFFLGHTNLLDLETNTPIQSTSDSLNPLKTEKLEIVLDEDLQIWSVESGKNIRETIMKLRALTGSYINVLKIRQANLNIRSGGVRITIECDKDAAHILMGFIYEKKLFKHISNFISVTKNEDDFPSRCSKLKIELNKIIILDQNTQINFEPLLFTVYLLFLKNPNGIRLMDFNSDENRSALIRIYARVLSCLNRKKGDLKSTIISMAKDARSEKFAKINALIKKSVKSTCVNHYCILDYKIDNQNKVKQILIASDPSMIIDEEGFLNF